MQRRVLQVLVVALGCACASRESYYRRETVGRVGCPPNEIELRDMHENTWTAICRGRAYYCVKDVPSSTEYLVGTDKYRSHLATCTPADAPRQVVAREGSPTPPNEHGFREGVAPYGNGQLRVRVGTSHVRAMIFGQPTDPSQRMEIVVSRSARVPVYEHCRNVELVIDGATTKLQDPTYIKEPQSSGEMLEFLRTPIESTAVEAFARAKTAKLKACRDSVPMRREQLELVVAFLAKWNEMKSVPPMAESVQAPQSTPAAIGCQYDTQCKGERVCVNHECVAPASGDAGAALTATGEAK